MQVYRQKQKNKNMKKDPGKFSAVKNRRNSMATNS